MRHLRSLYGALRTRTSSAPHQVVGSCSFFVSSTNRHPFSSFASRKARTRASRPFPRGTRNRFRPKPKKKIMFQSLGCPRNWVDTEVMMGLTVEGGLEVTQTTEEADYLVVNTCGFLASAREESMNAVQDMLSTKKPSSKLLVTGCMVNLHKEQILQQYPQVDAVLSSGAIDKIVETIHSLEHKDEGHEGEHSSSALRKSFLEAGDTPRFVATPPHYSYLKIAEGCKKRCSFCIIPKIKGALQSKPIPQLVDEFQALLQNDLTKEIILIAQDLGDYGKDLGNIKANGTSSDLVHLLRALLEASQDRPDLWVRLLYLYPDEITPDLIDLMQANQQIVRYLDLPIQHSHNDILRKMRRKTSSQQIQEIIQQLREKLPGIVIRTSLMVGFPGETDEHFEHLLQFVREQELDNVGVFTYSNEDEALSSRLPDHVTEEVKQMRYERLMETQYEIVQRHNNRHVGQVKTVVVEGLNELQQIVGRHDGQCPDIDGQVLIHNSGPHHIIAGQRYNVEITGHHDYDLIGKVVGAASSTSKL